MSDHRSCAHNLSNSEIKAWKQTSGLIGIAIHDFCDTGAVLYELSYQAIRELATFWVRNVPVYMMKNTNEYIKDQIFVLGDYPLLEAPNR